MVAIAPRFDPGADAGAALGQGLSNALAMGAKRQMALQALESLSQMDQEQFNQMSVPQQLAALYKPFAGIEGAGPAGGDIASMFLKERQRLAGAPSTAGLPEVPGVAGGGAGMGTAPAGAGSAPQGSATRPAAQPEQDPEITKVGPSLQGIPNNAPMEVRQIVESFPNLGAFALRGNPQGLGADQITAIVQDTVRRGGTAEQGMNNAKLFSDYLQKQAQFYQGIMDDVSQEAARIYGDSPMQNMFERVMQREADRQIDKGLAEPNSIRNVARQAAKNVEATINQARSVEGRPFWNVGLEGRKQKTGQWLNPLLKQGEIQSAVELAMSRDMGKDPETGSVIQGPDWGPVRATEIVQERVNPEGFRRVKGYASTLEDANFGSFAREVRPGQARQAAADRNHKRMVEILSDPKKFQDNDSLVLLRAYANQRGMTETEFARALMEAKQQRGGEYSDYQNWEESTLLPMNIVPSITELLNGKRTASDFIMGKLGKRGKM